MYLLSACFLSFYWKAEAWFSIFFVLWFIFFYWNKNFFNQFNLVQNLEMIQYVTKFEAYFEKIL